MNFNHLLQQQFVHEGLIRNPSPGKDLTVLDLETMPRM
mgnify:FL=1